MSWASLLESTRFTSQLERGSIAGILRSIAALEPSVFWYPGSGCDLVPLLLDVPNNPTQSRLYPLVGPNQKRRIILWMNDYADAYFEFPQAGEFLPDAANAGIWGRLLARAFVTRVEQASMQIGLGDGSIPIRVFDVEVSSPKRIDDADSYTIIFSPVESERLLNQVFVPHHIQLDVVALIRQGGFSCQRAHLEPGGTFDQYRDVPRLIRQHEEELGSPQCFLIDRDDVTIPGYHPSDQKIADWGTQGATAWLPYRLPEDSMTRLPTLWCCGQEVHSREFTANAAGGALRATSFDSCLRQCPICGTGYSNANHNRISDLATFKRTTEMAMPDQDGDLDLAIAEVHEVLAVAHRHPSLIPATHLYCEGWLLSIILSAQRRGISCLPFDFAEGAQIYCEGLLGSPFQPRRRHDELGEGVTNADAIVGHCSTRTKTVRGIQLAPGASQLVVIEAKINSPLSAGTANVRWYDQAARTIACMAQMIAVAESPIQNYTSLGFYVFAPDTKIEQHRVAANPVSVKARILERLELYHDELVPRRKWFADWCAPMVDQMSVECTSWESIIEKARENNPEFGSSLGAFYRRCLTFA